VVENKNLEIEGCYGETLYRGFNLYIAKRKNGATFWITD
jgi:hypothetical protein